MVTQIQRPATERDFWANNIEFLLSCIALSVGLGNVWRFPFTALENGGGAFLFPYIVVLFIIGTPIYYLEMILGQFSSRNSVDVFDLSPAMRGIGYGQLYATVFGISYYASILAIATKYFVDSFSSILPWSLCKPEWGADCINSSDKYANVTLRVNSSRYKSSAELYFYKEVLKERSSIEDGIGYPDLELSFYLGFAWICIYLILIKGTKSTGKASYVLAIFPYIIMGILFVRSVTLPGAIEGIMYLFTPRDIFNPKVWYAAVTQVFFSLAVCLGTIIMYSSFNRFSHNIQRDVKIITLLDTLTSIFSSVITFGILGNLAYESDTNNIQSVVQGGSGLVFVSYPNAIAKFHLWPQCFSILFFLMLFILGLGSNVGMTSVVLNVMRDEFPKLRYWQIILPIASMGLIYLTPGGQHILGLIDFFGVSFIALVLAIPELITFGWIYGVKRLRQDIKFMLNIDTSIYFRLCWGLLSPISMLAILFYQVMRFEQITYNGQEYPRAAIVIGWCIFVGGILQVPLWMLIALIQQWKSNNSLKDNIITIFSPSENWGPRQPDINARYKQFRNDIQYP